MSFSTLLLLLLVLQNAACGVAAWLAVQRLGLPLRAAWAGTCHGAASSVVLGLGLAWHAAGSDPGGGWSAPLLLVLASALARRGQAAWLHRPVQDGQQLCLLLGLGVLCWAMGGSAAAAGLREMLLAAAIGWNLLCMGSEQVQAVDRLFGGLHGWLLGAPGLLLGAACWFQMTVALALPLPVPEVPGTVSMLLLSAWASLALFQGTLIYLVGLRWARRLRRPQRPLPDLVLR